MVSKEKLRKILLSVQKPARYTGGELGQVIKDVEKTAVRYAFCFPDIYDIGMSNLGYRILYSLANEMENVWCERVFQPWPDFENQMKLNSIPLFSLESKTPLHEFDIIGFTLQYEMSYTTVLNMLTLGGVPILSRDRTSLSGIVIGGGPCAYNPEPLADFFDLFVIGEGEEVLPELLTVYNEFKAMGKSKKEFLLAASKIEGVYIPSFYDVEYDSDGKIKAFTPKFEHLPTLIKKRIIKDFDKVYFPRMQIVPYIDIVHDRVTIELFRGCIRGCRFCQAGYLYRPIRTKKTATLLKDAQILLQATGYEELSLCSLSSSDYPEIQLLIDELLAVTTQDNINLSLPSLRIDNFPKELAEKITRVKKTTFTFAPEAGSQRLRDVINKNITYEDIEKSAKISFENKNGSVKLYFMLGLPTETLEDIDAIAKLSHQMSEIFYKTDKSKRNRFVRISVSVSTFVPKPFTPFQWEAQDKIDSIIEKQVRLRNGMTAKNIILSTHKPQVSVIEAVMARGDRRLGPVIKQVSENGGVLEAWDEFFNFSLWQKAFDAVDFDMDFFASRKREFNECLPWDFIDIGVKKEHLIKEAIKAYGGEKTENCLMRCANCGANELLSGGCHV